MIHYIDARGKQCPIPVVETKKVLAHGAPGAVSYTHLEINCIMGITKPVDPTPLFIQLSKN